EKNQLRSIYHTYVYTYEEKISRLTQAIRDIVDRRSNTGWTTGNHTGEDVNVYAYGPGSDYFRGWHENAETGQLLKILAAGLSPDDDNYYNIERAAARLKSRYCFLSSVMSMLG